MNDIHPFSAPVNTPFWGNIFLIFLFILFVIGSLYFVYIYFFAEKITTKKNLASRDIAFFISLLKKAKTALKKNDIHSAAVNAHMLFRELLIYVYHLPLEGKTKYEILELLKHHEEFKLHPKQKELLFRIEKSHYALTSTKEDILEVLHILKQEFSEVLS